MGRLMALDVGDKRIGVALSDELKITTSPYGILQMSADITKEILQIVEAEDVEKIIVGLPRSMDGTFTEQSEKVKLFVAKFLSDVLPIEYEDETLTSKHADARLRDKKLSFSARKQYEDSYAAKIILDSYLARKDS